MRKAPRAPLAGRRIWLVGIGGAGLSAYGLLARAWGAQVGGWDRNETPYLAAVREAGIDVRVSPEPESPDGWEVFVSSAYAGVEGRPRADLLAELVSLRPSIVVAGAHGKTTTAGMIAFCLDQLDCDPAFLIGGEIPQLGGNARAGAGWLVAEGDESDRSLELLQPQIAVLTNIELDHHATFASEDEVRDLFESWVAAAPTAVRGDQLEPVPFDLGVPGRHNRLNAAAALEALELAGVLREAAEALLPEFRGAGRRFERRGEAGGVQVFDDYGHHPSEIAATLEAARSEAGTGRVLVVFQPHLFSRTRHVAAELAASLAAADAVAVTEVYAAREEPVPGVDGKLVVDELVSRRPGMAVAWTPALEDAARFLSRRARPGDLVVTIGAGDVERAGPLILAELA